MSNTGLDLFIAKPGLHDEVFCKVCGAVCEVRRNVYGPTSMASAMAKKFTEHDAFFCPHSNEDWHQQAIELLKAIEATPSKRVAALMQLDLEEILQDHDCK